MDEIKEIIAFIFKRSGNKILPVSDFYLAISMDLNWCSPKTAKAFTKALIEKGFLKEEKTGIIPSFDINSITIPTGFTPSDTAFDINQIQQTKDASFFENILTKIQTEKDDPIEQIVKHIEEIKNQRNINKEIAALLYAKQQDIDISSFLTNATLETII